MSYIYSNFFCIVFLDLTHLSAIIVFHKGSFSPKIEDAVFFVCANKNYNIENHNNLPQAPVSCRDDVRGAQNFKIGRALGKLLWISINSGLTMVFHNNLPTSCHKLSEQGWRGLYIRQIIVNNQI